MKSSSLSLFCILMFLVSQNPHHQQSHSPTPTPDGSVEPEPPNQSTLIHEKEVPNPNTSPESNDDTEANAHAQAQAEVTPSPMEGAIWDSLVNPQPGQFGSPIDAIEEPFSEFPGSADSGSSEEETLIEAATGIGQGGQQNIGDTVPSGPEAHTQSLPTKLIPNKSDSSSDSIPSFSEWTQLQLSQKEESNTNIQNPKNKTTIQNQEGKNFASPKCGAKIINSNQESHNPSGVLSSSLDDYMLNRCKDNIWFIVELCETVKLELVSIGNLELFSSNPKEFEFGVSDRYPTRDWKNFGPFTAPDQRILHSFHLPQTNSTFGKFLRVIVKAHHGKEHYCPLSLIKVFGKSEYDVLESETTHAEDEESSRASLAAAEEELAHNANSPDKSKNSIIGSATEVVIDIVKKAAGVLVNNKGKDDLVPGGDSRIFNSGNLSTNCITLIQCLPDTIELREKVIENLSCHRQLFDWLKTQLPWMEWSIDCHQLLQNNSFGSVSMFEGFLVAIYGQSMMNSLCHYVRPILTCPQNELLDSNLVQLTSGQPNLTSENNESRRNGNGESSAGVNTPGSPITNTNGNGTGSSQPTPPISSNGHAAQEQQTQQQQHYHPSEDSIPHLNQKESVFVRLSNRIKNLERNQSLSSGYLEELSRRFKKQSEEINMAHELFRATLTESVNRSRRDGEALWKEIKRLNRKIDNLRQLISEFELQRSGLVLFSLFQFCWILYLFWGIKKEQRKVIEYNEAHNSYDSLQRKRSNPIALRKVKRKRKKKDVQTSTSPSPAILDSELPQQQPIFPVPALGPSPTITNSQLQFKIPITIAPPPVFSSGNSIPTLTNNKMNGFSANLANNCESESDVDQDSSSKSSIANSTSFNIGSSGIGTGTITYRPNTPTKRKSNKFKSFFNFRQ